MKQHLRSVRYVAEPGPQSGTPFTEAEKDIIRRWYPSEGASGVAVRLSRTPETVKCKARKLGVTRSPELVAAHRYRFNGRHFGTPPLPR